MYVYEHIQDVEKKYEIQYMKLHLFYLALPGKVSNTNIWFVEKESKICFCWEEKRDKIICEGNRDKESFSERYVYLEKWTLIPVFFLAKFIRHLFKTKIYLVPHL